MSPKVSPEYMLARQREILDAATAVFSKKGFHAATLDDIAAEAGISKGSIYIHFESKEAIVDGLSQQWQRIDDEVFDAAEAMPRAIDGIAHVVKSTLRRSARPDFLSSIRLGIFVYAEVMTNPFIKETQIKLGEQWRKRFIALAEQAKAEGDIGPGYSVESVIALFGSLGGGFFIARGVWDAEIDVPAVEKLIDNIVTSLK